MIFPQQHAVIHPGVKGITATSPVNPGNVTLVGAASARAEDGEDAQVKDRPRNIVRFELLVYASLAMGLIIAPLQSSIDPTIAGIGIVTALCVLVAILAFFCWLVWLIARRGRTWAVWVFAVMLVGGTPFSVSEIIHFYKAFSPITFALATLKLTQAAMQVLSIFLLFTGSVRPWFNRAKHASPAATSNR